MTEEKAILRFILRYVPNISDARDVIEETFVTLWAKRGDFDATKEFLLWACGIARFKVKEFWRKRPRWESFANEDLITLIDARLHLHQDFADGGATIEAAAKVNAIPFPEEKRYRCATTIIAMRRAVEAATI